MEALFFITHSLHTYAHKSQLDLHVRLHSMTNSTTWIPFLLFECCELPLDAYWTACWALKEDALQAGFQAAPGSLLVTQWQQRCSSLKINRTFEEVLTRCANSDTQHSQSFSHQMKEDLCDQSHLFVIFLFFLMTFYSSAMSHFSNQSCDSHAAVVDVMGSFCPNGSTLSPVGKMSRAFSSVSSLSFAACVSSSSLSSVLCRHRLLHPINHCEKGSVCVCISRNLCGTIADGLHRIQEFLGNSNDPSPRFRALSSLLIVFPKNPDLPAGDFPQWHTEVIALTVSLNTVRRHIEGLSRHWIISVSQSK